MRPYSTCLAIIKIVLCEYIVQQRYLFFVKLCFDNIMSIIMKVSYMKSNNARHVKYGLIHHQPVKVSIALYFIIARHVEYGLIHLQPVKVSIALYFI
jgi:hypothetical protein